MKSKLLFLLMQVLCFTITTGQNQNSKWHFGEHVGMDFMPGNPVLLNNSAINTMEGSSSIADAAGNLLFYTDGVTVYNASNAIMANGTGLMGNQSTSQAALIIKKPGSTTLYYIFTLGACGGGLSYSVVDMSLAAGLGSVTVLNTPLLNSQLAEFMHGTRHANGTDYWIVVHTNYSNLYRAFLLSSTGVNPTSVNSPAGTNFQTISCYGCMKISPTGSKIGFALGNVQQGWTEVADFNNATGQASNAITLMNANYYYAYGCEFSPDGTKFYACGHSGALVTQWDLNAGSAAAVISSSVNLFTNGFFASMQLAPNGKLYMCNKSSTSITVVHSPNAAGVSCNFDFIAQPVNTLSIFSNTVSRSQYGLPNHIAQPCTISFSMTNNNLLCNGGVAGATVTSVAGNTGAVSYFWSNGTTTFSTSQVNSLPNGSWSLTLSDNTGCKTHTLFTVVQPPPLNPSITVTSSNVCSGATVALTGIGASSYTWNTGAQSNSIIVTPTANTQYSFICQDQYGCTQTISAVSISVSPVPTVVVSAGSYSICRGSSQTLSVSGAPTYSWSTGSPSASIVVSPTITTNYTVNGFNTIGCKTATNILIVVFPIPTLTTNSLIKLCGQKTISLSATGASSYVWTWSLTATTQSLTVTVGTLTQFTVTGTDGPGCSSSKVVTVTVGCTGIENLLYDAEEVRIFPNPAIDFIKLDAVSENSATDLSIYDASGSMIRKASASPDGINISDLPSGTYFLMLQYENEALRFAKFLKVEK